MTGTTNNQWIRRFSLVVTDGSQGLDLSDFRVRFRTAQSDTQSPNNVEIRVYNLSDATAKQVQAEYTRVILQAGYQTGNFGVIFDGTIKQFRKGRESATDTYLDILAADGDQAYNFAVSNQTLAAGSTPQDHVNAALKSMGAYDVDGGYIAPMTGGTLPRGKVLFGMARDTLRDTAATQVMSWSIQNGKLQMVPLTGYLPGEAVVLNVGAGMIGVPEQTENGIEVRCLLNPKIQIGALIQIDNASINQTVNKDPQSPIPFDQWTGIQLLASISADGLYRTYVVEHQGDTWGNEWYSLLTCLSVDRSSDAANSVLRYPGDATPQAGRAGF
jgi:hypothetical protein